MLDTPRIFGGLSPGLQQRLAQFALLQQRTAVLACLPRLTLTRGRPVRWAATPMPVLVSQVVLLAGRHSVSPHLSELLLHNWFLHKGELHYLVRNSLRARGYHVPPSGVLPRFSEWAMRLDPDDRRPVPGGKPVFCPDGEALPDTAGSSAEEATLMAGLLGWPARRPAPEELPPFGPWRECLSTAYQALSRVRELVQDARPLLRPGTAAAAALARGELPAEMDPITEKKLNWRACYEAFLGLWGALYKVAGQPAPDPASPLRTADLVAVVDTIETHGRAAWKIQQTGEWLAQVLADLQGIYHRTQPDFAPLVAFRAQVRTLAEGLPAVLAAPENGALADCLTEAMPLMGLHDLIIRPTALDEVPDPEAIDPAADERLQAIGAGLAPALRTALLLGKLALGPSVPLPAAPEA